MNESNEYGGLRRRVLEANLLLARSGLVILTWGNVSEMDRAAGVFAIKPSGVPYDRMTEDDIVVMSLETGEKVWGKLNPSSDTPTHLKLYQAWPDVNGVCHAHSTYATVWSQAARAIPCLGTTHADTFNGEIPVTRRLTTQEIDDAYEAATGDVIIEAFRSRDPSGTPAALVRQHGPFTWGKNAVDSVEHMMILEQCARIAHLQYEQGVVSLHESLKKLDESLRRKHYERKHGANATYGQLD
ncbi:MAG: L-ribulose-5-phosphate 4-epimerase AraD [Oscillospiraceae bacterium]|jgi:L-ribulose-5-phosphate 4-epimerase|nr:L-ribulose-5-phosphate 4-epimerase AraD [Oscillospiraceae bacterium]